MHEVFSRNHAAPFSKVLTFLRRGPFELEAFYSDPQGVPYPEAKIGKQAHGVHLLLELQLQLAIHCRNAQLCPVCGDLVRSLCWTLTWSLALLLCGGQTICRVLATHPDLQALKYC